MSAELDRLDDENRARALDLDTSFIVQAPAGAGKTELLTQRYLKLLAHVDAPEQIIAITFTKKAAAEMRARILLRLAKAGEAEPAKAHEKISWQLARAVCAHDLKQGWGLTDNPERLRIMTIDALCASLVRQMPYLSRFGAMPRIADKPALHYEEAARRAIAAIEDVPAVAQALARLDNDAGRLRRLLEAMLASREQWLPHVTSLRSGSPQARERLGEELTYNLQRLVARDLAVVTVYCAELQTPELFAAARHVAVAIGDQKPEFAPLADWSAPLMATADDLPRWQALAALLLSSSGDPRKAFDARMGLPAGKDPVVVAHKATLKAVTETLAENPATLEALRAATRCPVPQYAAADLAAIETFAEVLLLAVDCLWKVFQESGETDFSAVAERAVAALGAQDDPTELALRLDYAIRHLLVDEFQDTNPQQIELLQQLTAGWSTGEPRTLFVVGDPMQSIYRFRKADVGLFLRAWDHGIGDIALERLVLYRNNRSAPAIVDWVNAAFQTIFPSLPDAERGRVSYAASIPTRPVPDGVSSGVTVHPLVMPKEVVDDDGDAREAQAMLDIIDATWRESPKAEIAVLVRARDHLSPLVDALRRTRPKLRYEAVEIESLGARQPIQDLLSLTHALCHRADRVNWLAVLRAPWCGLTLADLHALAKVDAGRTAAPTVWALMQDATLSADGQQRLIHARNALRPLVEAPGRLPLRRTVESAWRRLGGPACLSGANDQADVAGYFTLLDTLEASGRFALEQLAAEVASLYAAPSSDPQAVQLKFMTIHKAKGLEFDTVILPGLHRRTARNETKLLAWDSAQDAEGHHRLVVAPYRQRDEEEAEDDDNAAGESIRRYIEALEAARADQETRRVLYVAATRAVRRLHLLAAMPAKRDLKTGLLQIEAPKKLEGKPINMLWPVVSQTFAAAAAEFDRTADAVTGTGAADLAKFVPQLQRLHLSSLPVERQATDVSADAPDAPAAPQGLTSSALAPQVGTLVHRYLELIAGAGVDGWDAQRIEGCRAACEKWFRQQGNDGATSRLGAERVLRALTRAVTSERGRWILQARPAAYCELALTQFAEAALSNHIIDRTFIEDGVRWIIDYKTGAHEGGDGDAFIAAKRLEYAPQLARYAALFPGETVRQALYFVDCDRFEVLADSRDP